MLDKLLKMDTTLQTIKTQVAKYKALFAADGTIDAADQAMLDAMEKDVLAIEKRLGKAVEKAKENTGGIQEVGNVKEVAVTLELDNSKGIMEESLIKAEEIVTPYPNFQIFKAAIMPLLENRIEEYLNKYGNNLIATRGGISYVNSLLGFLSIADINNWRVAFRTDPNIDNYLQNIYNNHQAQLTSMSVGKYANIIARNIWLDFVEGGLTTAQPIQAIDFTPANSTNYNLSDELEVIQAAIPRGFQRRVNQFQQNMLNPAIGQPNGYENFTAEWKKIIAHIHAYETSATPHSEMSQRQILQNIQNMFTAIDNLIATGNYFTYNDFKTSENVVVVSNSDNGIPSTEVNNSNSQGSNTSETTEWIFNSGYKLPPPGDLNIDFPPVPPIPEEFREANAFQWLFENGFFEPTDLAVTQSQLTKYALYLQNRKEATMIITGVSNHGVINGETTNLELTKQIGLGRADAIKTILIKLGARPSQISTASEIGEPKIKITMP